MKNFLNSRKARLNAAITAVVTGSAVVSVSATAADYTAQIATASTDGSGNVTAVIAAVIGIAILGFGVGSMMGWFKR